YHFLFRFRALILWHVCKTKIEMQNILVPTDFSENAFNALTYGLTFFKKTRCTFYLLHVDTVAPYSNPDLIGNFTETSDSLEENLSKEHREDMRGLLRRVEGLGL